MMKPTIDLTVPRKALYAAVVGGLVAFNYSTGIRADVTANPDAAAKPLMLASSCNPCAAKKAACGACNPCAAKKTSSACNPCNPCAAKKVAGGCNPCNPCGAAAGPKMLVSGILVDTRCYGFDNSNVGNTHKMGGAKVPGCATACAKMGIPVAILDGGQSGGQLYALAAPAPAFAEYMGMQARMTGTEIVNGVMLPVSLEVKTKKGWKKVSAKGMM